jgi:glyoxylase-like metal-dependent hydrolase (beta-lactamase superfamily II)/rhodanese-related sulfurtransferase
MINEITAEELKLKLESGEDIEVIDIREEEEYREWHIQPSTNIPVYNALNSGQVKPLMKSADRLPKDKPVVLYCRVGNTSKFSSQILNKMGFDTYSLIGGIHGWSGVASEATVSLKSKPEATLIQIRRNGKGCLSYLVGSNGEAAVIDPSVDVSIYLKIAERENLKITKVIETHVHADHLSRATELHQATGAEYLLPENDRANLSFSPIRDGDEIPNGEMGLKVIHTPGHTGESVCLLAEEEILFTGDTIFVDGLGRPDLEKGNEGAEEGANLLYQSLHKKVLTLSENIMILPGHHGKPISFDGRPIEASLKDLKSNLPLLKTEQKQFVGRILSGLSKKPPNFSIILAVNEGKQRLGFINPLDLEAGPNRCAAS